jgi:hypothetical protein
MTVVCRSKRTEKGRMHEMLHFKSESTLPSRQFTFKREAQSESLMNSLEELETVADSRIKIPIGSQVKVYSLWIPIV